MITTFLVLVSKNGISVDKTFNLSIIAEHRTSKRGRQELPEHHERVLG